MRIATANLRNYPDMSREKVAEDAQRMGWVSDLWGHQENNPAEDDQVVLKALGKDWAGALVNTDIPMYFRRKTFKLQSARVHEMPFDPILPLTPRPRLLTGATFKLRGRSSVPSFVVVNCHLIAGAYNGDNSAADTKRRQRQWDIEWRHLVRFVAEYRAKGNTVFVLGDFNHPRPPKPLPNFTWLVGERLDRIGVTTHGRVGVEEISDGTVPLNSDHDGQWTRVLLTRN